MLLFKEGRTSFSKVSAASTTSPVACCNKAMPSQAGRALGVRVVACLYSSSAPA